MTWKRTNRLRMQQRWHKMLNRCYDPDDPHYRWYGARGIRVRTEWMIFDRYYADVGDPPGPGYTLDRTDNDKGYGPDNFRWATRKQQAENRRPMAAGRRYTIAGSVEPWDYSRYLDRNAIAH